MQTKPSESLEGTLSVDSKKLYIKDMITFGNEFFHLATTKSPQMSDIK